jgi:hypothetical protein
MDYGLGAARTAKASLTGRKKAARKNPGGLTIENFR